MRSAGKGVSPLASRRLYETCSLTANPVNRHSETSAPSPAGRGKDQEPYTQDFRRVVQRMVWPPDITPNFLAGGREHAETL